MKWTFLILAGLFVGTAHAYIPPTRMIIERTADNAGSGSYTIEQEVQFSNGTDLLTVRETWEVDRDRAMKVTVSGVRDLKDRVRAQILYAGGQKWSLSPGGKRESSRIPADFTERLFHWRDLNTAAAQLTAMRLVSPQALQKKTLPRKSEDIRHTPEEGVRLARTGGVIAWAFGNPSSPTSEQREPGLWIEQDQFVIRKIRYPSLAEMTAEQYSSYPRGLQLPKVRTLQWGAQTVTIRLLSVNGRGPAALSTGALEITPRWDGLTGQPAQKTVEEFYSRFR